MNKLLSKIKLIIEKFKSEKDYLKRYYEIGKLIINEQDNFPSKEQLLIYLSEKLGEGYGKANLSDMRRLYETYKDFPEQFKFAQKIGWSHNRKLLKTDIEEKLRYELLKYAIEKNVSARELEIKLNKKLSQKKVDTGNFKIEIKSIKIENFKSVVDIEIKKPNSFTVFVGSNACGKSNIFSAIDMLFEAYYSTPIKSFNEHGGNRIFNFKKKNEDIKIELKTSSKEKITFINDVAENNTKIQQLKDLYNKKITNKFTFLSIKDGSSNNSKNPILEKDGSNYHTILKEKIFSDLPSKDAFIRKLKNIIPEISEANIEKNAGGEELYIKDKNYPDEKIYDNLFSSGTKNMIILLTAILQSKEPQFVCIEEPENGLHPLILEPLIDTIRSICETEGHYIWLTTHSPVIVRHLERKELMIVDKKNGETLIKKASEKIFNDYFTGDNNFKLDDAWLTDIFEGGLPWS